MDLSCAICVKLKTHADHPSDLVPMTEAAENARKKFEDAGSAVRHGCHNKLTRKLQSLQESKEDIKRQCKAVSRDISAAFEEKFALLKRRESRLLAEVDQLCWKKLEPLESECIALNEGLDMLPSLASLAGACAGDSDILRLSPWLLEKEADIGQSAKKNDLLLRKCNLSCLNLSKGPNSDSVRQIGFVLDDNDVDASASSFEVHALAGTGVPCQIIPMPDHPPSASYRVLQHQGVVKYFTTPCSACCDSPP